jgi:hypothetical protein
MCTSHPNAMRWESPSIVLGLLLAGAVAAEGDEADSEADCEKVSDPDLNNSSTGVVCQCGRQRESPPLAPFRRPPAAAAVTGSAGKLLSER